MAIVGIKFPFSKGVTSLPAQSFDNDVIRENLERILQTRRGSRVMRPTSGSDCWSFVFENTGPVLNARMDHEVRRAIAEGEPRATVLNVSVAEVERSDGGVNVVVTIVYRVNLDVQQIGTTFVRPASG